MRSNGLQPRHRRQPALSGAYGIHPASRKTAATGFAGMPVLGAHAGSLTRSLRQSVETLAVTIVLVTALARGAAAQGNVSIGSSSITGCCDTTVGVTVDSADSSLQFVSGWGGTSACIRRDLTIHNKQA